MNEKEVLKRGYAQTREEWWLLFEDRKEDLTKLMTIYLRPPDTAHAKKCIASRDAAGLWMALQTTWERLPDTPAVRSFAGFGRLCDLCSDFPKEGDGNDGQEKD